jgi:hypothetical protein
MCTQTVFLTELIPQIQQRQQFPLKTSPYWWQTHLFCINFKPIALGCTLDYDCPTHYIRAQLHAPTPQLVDNMLVLSQPPVLWVPGLSKGVESGRGVTLTPHPLLVPRSKNRAELYLLLSLRAFVACKKGETYMLSVVLHVSVALHVSVVLHVSVALHVSVVLHVSGVPLSYVVQSQASRKT